LSREQLQLARENPLAAAAAAAAVAGNSIPQNNIENLLDIDFDGAAPASLQKQPAPGHSGLEGLAGTPQRVASPASSTPASNMDDLMGLFGGSAPSTAPAPAPLGGTTDMLNGLASLNVGTSNHPPPAVEQVTGSSTNTNNQDIMDLI
jgi:AP-1 complex subunit beta-1